MSKYCTNCGKENKDEAKFCLNCGAELRKPKEPEPETQVNTNNNENTSMDYSVNNYMNIPDDKSMAISMILSILLGFFGLLGFGYLYLGEYGKFGVFFIIGILFNILIYFISPYFSIISLIFWIYQIYDTYKITNEMNDRRMQMILNLQNQ